MPVNINGTTYFRTLEVLKQANISRSTLLRWVENGVLPDAGHRDRRGWRLFNKTEIDSLIRETKKIQQK